MIYRRRELHNSIIYVLHGAVVLDCHIGIVVKNSLKRVQPISRRAIDFDIATATAGVAFKGNGSRSGTIAVEAVLAAWSLYINLSAIILECISVAAKLYGIGPRRPEHFQFQQYFHLPHQRIL